MSTLALERPATEDLVLSKAAIRTAERLGLTSQDFAAVLGLSEASISRLRNEKLFLHRGQKAFELALLLVRLFRSLDAITGGDEMVSRRWMKAHNSALGGLPVEKIKSIAGLMDVIAYLDTRRAIL
ncbi:MbcA/ParS/Xre antitoxin family protein [Limoniibacter endophyticus]|uniref:DUF2384 domain-containing protein n=1 Tax=Limoniibacter endophyticus TaxID=1565040 RepID=A0A8J3DQ41_9HYPH|nr:MbcA/ParS/Xre antitoxin family protein [Limoniibacter endophyticus]GHC72843.1 hypothetical protein GCM10010136_20840 [Limoniibacter endophyticus]